MFLRKLQYSGLDSIDFTRADEPRMWTVLLGEDSGAKSTLLQAVALASVGPATANQLTQSMARPFKIEAEFGFDPEFHEDRPYPGLEGISLPNPPRLVSFLELVGGKRSWSGDSRYIAPEGVDDETRKQVEGVKDPLSLARSEESLPYWSVSSYGPLGDVGDPLLDRLSSLFSRTVNHNAIDVDGVANLIGELSGLVLVDEVDLHLHPKCQVEIITALKEAFPRVQFIVTANSPLVLAGSRKDEVLEIKDGVAVAADNDPRLKTTSELYRDFFGIKELYPTALARMARDYRRLASNPFRSDVEDAEMKTLADELTKEGVDFAAAVKRRSR